MYFLLCGERPFEGDDNNVIMEEIIKGEFDFPSPAWDLISDEARNLIYKLLQKNYKKRITAKKALKHPFIK